MQFIPADCKVTVETAREVDLNLTLGQMSRHIRDSELRHAKKIQMLEDYLSSTIDMLTASETREKEQLAAFNLRIELAQKTLNAAHVKVAAVEKENVNLKTQILLMQATTTSGYTYVD